MYHAAAVTVKHEMGRMKKLVTGLHCTVEPLHCGHLGDLLYKEVSSFRGSILAYVEYSKVSLIQSVL